MTHLRGVRTTGLPVLHSPADQAAVLEDRPAGQHWGTRVAKDRLKIEIETPRLRLRTPLDRDVRDIVYLANDKEIARNTTGVPHPYSIHHGMAFIAMVNLTDPDVDLPLLVEHRSLGPAGMVGLHRRDEPWSEIGYWLGRDFWGQGIATEAADALLDWAYRIRGDRVVSSGHFADNAASGRVLEKLGFLYTGEIRQRRSHARRDPTATRMMIRLL